MYIYKYLGLGITLVMIEYKARVMHGEGQHRILKEIFIFNIWSPSDQASGDDLQVEIIGRNVGLFKVQ